VSGKLPEGFRCEHVMECPHTLYTARVGKAAAAVPGVGASWTCPTCHATITKRPQDGGLVDFQRCPVCKRGQQPRPDMGGPFTRWVCQLCGAETRRPRGGSRHETLLCNLCDGLMLAPGSMNPARDADKGGTK
jgi:rubredoxin